MIDLENLKQFTRDNPPEWNVFGAAEDFEKLPQTHKEQLLFLEPEAEKFLYEYLKSCKLMTGPVWDPFEQGNFKSVISFDNFRNEEKLKKWLYELGIPFKNWVLMLPNYHSTPVYCTWKMVVKYGPDLFGQSDDIAIFDQTNNWCLFYFHEGKLFFGKDLIYDPETGYKEMEALQIKKRKFPKFKHRLLP